MLISGSELIARGSSEIKIQEQYGVLLLSNDSEYPPVPFGEKFCEKLVRFGPEIRKREKSRNGRKPEALVL